MFLSEVIDNWYNLILNFPKNKNKNKNKNNRSKIQALLDNRFWEWD